MISPQEERVFSLLSNYYDAIRSLKSENPMDLTRAVTDLEEASRNPSEELPSSLKHYLQSRSYRKAYEMLGGEVE